MNTTFLTSRSCECGESITLEPFWFEDLDFVKWVNFFGQNRSIPFYGTVVYLAVIFTLRHLMKTRRPFQLQKPLILWNMAMGIFSVFGFVRVTPELYLIWSKASTGPDAWYKMICLRGDTNPPLFAWAMFFIFSKFVELGDTVFIVLKKRPLTFLHWYHHAITLILCWVTAQHCEPIYRIFLWMNLGVHGIMYPYFALKAMRFHIPKRVSMCLTTLQLVQMFVGVLANIYTVSVLYNGGDCIRHPETIKWFGGVYLSFAVLFGKFLYTTYFSKNKSKRE